jgi:serine/threonine-protein kinase
MLLGEWVVDGDAVGGPLRDPAGLVRAIALFRFAPEREFLGFLAAPAPLAFLLVEGERLRAELDVDAVLAPARPVRDAFALLLPLPGLVTLGVLFPTFHARFRGRPRKGSRLGSYVLERRLGQGGMAEVFLGHHAALGRPAALKILHPGRIATARRFEQEARLASRLAHPNLVQVFEFGETSGGRLYYAMEYVKGLTLAQLLALEGRLPVARSLHLLRQISAALEEAHRLGLLHRDLKPANVMVCSQGGMADLIKVLDFGIACSISGGDGTAELVGTPAYIAPERIRSERARDPRSDVYSFGAVAFHLLTGRNVFEGAAPAELIYQALTAERPSPSQLRGSLLPDPLEALIRNCLALEPESRPSDFREIGETLRAVKTPDRWSPDDARAWWAQNEERIGMFRDAAAGGP